MKRTIFSLLLALGVLLLFSVAAWAETAPEPAMTDVAVPEIAAEPAQPDAAADSELSTELAQELAQVTQKVKATLGLGDGYSNFSGYPQEQPLGRSWSLHWSNVQEEIYVEADAAGLVTSYSRYSYSDRTRYSSDFAPKFPTKGRPEARQIAEAFLAKVLAANETPVFETYDYELLEARERNSYYFYGTLQLNGVASPLSFNIDVDLNNLRVSSFYRDTLAGNGYLGSLPSATPTVTAQAAAQKLAAEQKFELAYFLTEANDKEARLQYRPKYTGAFIVDAQTGQLLDVDKLYDDAKQRLGDVSVYHTADEAAAEDAGGSFGGTSASISAVEQEGISKLEGMLSKEQLDAKARAIAELGLTNFKLSGVNYHERWDGREGYLASLSYYREADAASLGITEQAFQQIKQERGSMVIYKYVELEALSGKLESLYTNLPYLDSSLITAKKGNYQSQATAFMQKYHAQHLATCALDDSSETADAGSDFLYQRQVNGYSFAENYYLLGYNPYTGDLQQFGSRWDDDIKFAPATGLIGEDKAKQLYLDTQVCRLAYVGLPQAIDPTKPEMLPYLDYYGHSFLYEARLAYQYTTKNDGSQAAYAIDALTGELLRYASGEQQLSYQDLAGVAAKAKIEELARYGIGFTGGSFQATAELAELDMIVFLLSANGSHYDLTDLNDDMIKQIYQQAYANNIIATGQERQPERKISRGELLKTIIGMSGYGKTAMLPDIYQCNFADAASIPAEYIGYAAIAQGLGLVEGGSTVSLKATETVNREEAAVIFYNFLARQY